MMTYNERIENIKKIIPQKYHSLSFEDENFVNALEKILPENRDNKPLLIQGPGGCGKSELYKIIEDTLRDKCLVMASTGVAAVNLETADMKPRTIHSTLRFDVKSFYEPEPNYQALTNLKNKEVVLIDEVSMVNANFLDYIFMHVLEAGERGKKIKLVLFGDPLQLPPVDKRNQDEVLKKKMEEEGYENINFFNSFYWKALKGEVINLSKIYRQTDKVFMEILNRIRETRETDEDISYLNARIQENNERGYKNRLLEVYVTRKEVSDVNTKCLNALKAQNPKSHTYSAAEYVYDNGQPVLKDDVSYTLIPQDDDFYQTIEIYEGERVMCTRNEPGLSFCNGTIGTVIGFTEKNNLPIIQTDAGKIITIVPLIYTEIYSDNEKVYFVEMSQIPLKPAYAITFHKCQGLTLDAVKLNFTGNVWFDSLTYVGLSRVKNLAGLYTNRPIKREDLHADSEALCFWNNHTAVASSV